MQSASTAASARTWRFFQRGGRGAVFRADEHDARDGVPAKVPVEGGGPSIAKELPVFPMVPALVATRMPRRWRECRGARCGG